MAWRDLSPVLRAPEGEASGGGGAASSPPPPEASSEVPAWARPLLETHSKLEGRLSDMGKQLARLKEERKALPKVDGEAASTPVQAPAAEDFRGQLKKAMAYAAVKAQLPEAAVKRLDALEQEGADYARLLDLATIAHDLRPASNGPQGAPSPRSHGATPATPTVTDAWPKTWSEAKALRAKSPEAYAKIEAQGFDITTLPRM